MLEAALSTFPPDIQEQATKSVDAAASPDAPEVAEPLKTVDSAPPLKNENAQNKAAEPQSNEENASGSSSPVESTPKSSPDTLLSASVFVSVKPVTVLKKAEELRILTVTQTVTVQATTANAGVAL